MRTPCISQGMGLFLAGIIWMGMCLSPACAARSRSDSIPAHFAVFADDSSQADTACMEAEQIQQDFQKAFDLPVGPSPIQVVIVLGGVEPARVKEKGEVRVFPHPPSYKLQVNWDKIPISRNAFQRGVVRALCCRQALLARLATRSKTSAELRIPIWVTEGIAACLAEPMVQQEIRGRAALLAKLYPQLPMDQAIAMVQGRSELNATQQAIAYVFCQAIVRDPDLKRRFMQSLLWEKNENTRTWLERLVSHDRLDEWWKGVWEFQFAQVPMVKLGFNSSLDIVWKWEMDPSIPIYVNTALHPFFRSWLKQGFAQAPSKISFSQLAKIRQDIQARRSTALEWFSDIEVKQAHYTREDLLVWALLYHDHEATVFKRGPAGRWLDSLTK